MENEKTIRIIVADDHKLFAAGIERLLSNEPDFVVEKVVHSGKEAIAAIEQNSSTICHFPILFLFGYLSLILNQSSLYR